MLKSRGQGLTSCWAQLQIWLILCDCLFLFQLFLAGFLSPSFDNVVLHCTVSGILMACLIDNTKRVNNHLISLLPIGHAWQNSIGWAETTSEKMLKMSFIQLGWAYYVYYMYSKTFQPCSSVLSSTTLAFNQCYTIVARSIHYNNQFIHGSENSECHPVQLVSLCNATSRNLVSLWENLTLVHIFGPQ